MRQSYQRPLLPPGERPIMLHLGTRFVNAVMTSNLEMFAGVAKKPQHRGAPIKGKPRAARASLVKFFLEHLAGPCTHFGDGLWLF